MKTITLSDEAAKALAAIVDHAIEVLELDDVIAEAIGIEEYDHNDGTYDEIGAVWDEIHAALK